ncbi:DUF4145 domain-containing protein [Salinicola sp. MH3R3-1]|uniref:DUF4145 domain-containing protein n=1 Tax=Salinicola sp. MH3R3-1 TaxID=1928762 RepID=UPI001439EF9C|nr:DUF4145 domain-containing protein [Salinicola sp. MH3R3-1]
MRWEILFGDGSPHLWLCRCAHCEKYSYWSDEYHFPKQFHKKMLYPIVVHLPAAHEDMPNDAKVYFNEAREVFAHSPRAAAALLRLSLQVLCSILGKSKNINKAIGELVSDGLPREVQMALDAIRIIGNESVHPGEIQDSELSDGVGKAFELLNFIVQDRITRLKEVSALYNSLPVKKLDAVNERDKNGKA